MKLHKCCGKYPLYVYYQANENIYEGYFKCEVCGKESDRPEDVWGGIMLKQLAVDCWNSLFEVVE